MQFNRHDVVQKFLELFETPAYLEIGVHLGLTFNEIKASRKVGVDPHFLFDYESIAITDASAVFYEVPSDEFFGNILDADELFDVIFLDGLHEAGQTIRDLLNAVMHLKSRGVIIIDDVEPDSYEASLADTSAVHAVRGYLSARNGLGLGESWMGDVYKVPFFIEAFMQQFSFATIQENHGQTILWRESRNATEISGRSLAEIDSFQFKDFVQYRASLNHVPFEKLYEHISRRVALV